MERKKEELRSMVGYVHIWYIVLFMINII
jgi:hypothetical protein